MSVTTILIIILLLLLIGALPGGSWRWHDYGWYPSGGVGLVLLVIVILILLGRL